MGFLRDNFDDDVASGAKIEKRGGEWCAVFQMAAMHFTCLDEFGRYYELKTMDDFWNKKPVWTDEVAMTLAQVRTRSQTAAYLNQNAYVTNQALRDLKKQIAAERRTPK